MDEAFPRHYDYDISDIPAEDIQALLLALVAVRDSLTQAARGLALDGVENGFLTRREVAAELGVHPITISRWLTARQVEQSSD
jgi:hypothetical protein